MAQAPHLIDGRQLTPSESPEYIASGPMPFDDYLAWDHEGGLVEWVDGKAYVYMSATYEHQQIVDFLSRLVGLWAEATGSGAVLTAPYAMRAEPGGPAREPDVVFVASERRDRLHSRYLVGPPDLAIEVVSPDSVARDRATKRAEYARAGIREYWVIDARPGIRRAEFFVLRDSQFVDAPAVDGVYRSAVLEGFWLRTDWLWDGDVRVLSALAEVLGRDPLGQMS